jgi:thioredoxin-dependent peroxiredoxin
MSRHSTLLAAIALAALAANAGAQSATQAGTAATAAPTGPDVGQPAPDFTAAWADSAGARSTPVSLASLRGKVVVLAFYPKDRTSGCTAELTKFRDEYKTLFGDGVVVLPTSVDTLASHASWAKDSHFPFAMIADPTAAVATKYASAVTGRKYFNRTVYVIGRDGKVAYADGRFGALNQDAYDKLAAAIKAAKGS